MARVFPVSQYFTRGQSDARYTRKPDPPVAPTSLVNSGTGIQITETRQFAFLDFTFTPPAGEPFQEYDFEFTWKGDDDLQTGPLRVIQLPADGPFRINGLEPGIFYDVRVRAIDFFAQLGAWTSIVSAQTETDSTAPASPTIVVTQANRGAQVTLSLLNIEPDFSHYVVERSTDSGMAGAIDVGQFFGTVFNDQAIPTADDYFYRIKAVDKTGNESLSNIDGPITLQDTDEDPPTTPVLAGATAAAQTDGSIKLDWSRDDTSQVLFRVYRQVQSSGDWLVLTTLVATATMSYIDTTSVNGVTYDYEISAINSVGDESPRSASTLSATAADTSDPNPATVLVFEGGRGRVRGSWVPSTSNDVVQYSVRWQLDGGGWNGPFLVGQTEFTLFGLTDTREELANKLEFEITAKDEVGNSSTTLTSAVTFPELAGYAPADNTIPHAPIFVTPTLNGDGSITLSWVAPNLPDVRGYRIDRLRSDVGNWELLTVLEDDTLGTKTFTDLGLEPFTFRGIEYRYRVRTLDHSGNISAFNLVDNSSFEDGLTGWTAAGDGGAISTAVGTPVRSGTGAARANFAGRLSQEIPVTAGIRYALSAFVQQDSPAGASSRIEVDWLNSGNVSQGTISDTVVTQGNFLRPGVEGVAPATTVKARVTLEGDSVNPITSTFFWEDVQFEEVIFDPSAAPTIYAEGKTDLLRAVDTTGPPDYAGIALTAQPKLGAIRLEWVNPDSPNPDYINSVFEIHRATGSGGPWNATSKIGEVPGAPDGGANSYEDLDPEETASTTSFYKLRARDRFGNIGPFLNSDTSVSATSRTLNDDDVVVDDGVAPATPASFVKLSDGLEEGPDGTLLAFILLQWAANTEPDLGIYELRYWRTDATTEIVRAGVPADVSPQTVKVSGLIPNQTYTFEVRAVDVHGNSSAFATLSSQTMPADSSAPSVPVITATAGAKSVRLEITTPATEADLSHYEIYRHTSDVSGSSTLIGTTVEVSYVDSPLTVGTALFYWMKSIDFSGNASAFSASKTAIPLPVPSDEVDRAGDALDFIIQNMTALGDLLDIMHIVRTLEDAELTRGLLTGIARDTDVITFNPQFELPPVVRVVPGQCKTYFTGDSANDQYLSLDAQDVTATGFTIRAKVIIDTFTTILKTVTTTTLIAIKNAANGGGAEEAFNDLYTFKYDVTVQEAFFKWSRISVGFWEREFEGTWVLRATKQYTNTDLVDDLILTDEVKTIIVDGAGDNHEFKITAENTAENGGNIDDFVNLTYYEPSSAPIERNATPDASDFVTWFAVEGEN